MIVIVIELIDSKEGRRSRANILGTPPSLRVFLWGGLLLSEFVDNFRWMKKKRKMTNQSEKGENSSQRNVCKPISFRR